MAEPSPIDQFCTKFAELWPFASYMLEPGNGARGEWVRIMAKFPLGVALQALSDIWQYQDRSRTPTATVFREVADRIRALGGSRNAPTYHGQQMTWRTFVETTDWSLPKWQTPFVQDRLEAWKRGAPLVGTLSDACREPGEEG